jgi:hypothetical protein
MPSPTLGSAGAPFHAPGPQRTASQPAAEGSAPASLSEIDRLRIQGLTGNDPLVAIQALREMRVPGTRVRHQTVDFGEFWPPAPIKSTA